MKGQNLLLALIVTGCLAPMNSTPMRSVDVAELTAEADLIVVGHVAKTSPTGKHGSKFAQWLYTSDQVPCLAEVRSSPKG